MDNSGACRRRHLYTGTLYRKKTSRGDKDLGYVKIENTPSATVAVFANTLLKDSRPGARVIVGVQNPYEEEPKGIILQILRHLSPEVVERVGRVSTLFLPIDLSC